MNWFGSTDLLWAVVKLLAWFEFLLDGAWVWGLRAIAEFFGMKLLIPRSGLLSLFYWTFAFSNRAWSVPSAKWACLNSWPLSFVSSLNWATPLILWFTNLFRARLSYCGTSLPYLNWFFRILLSLSAFSCAWFWLLNYNLYKLSLMTWPL